MRPFAASRTVLPLSIALMCFAVTGQVAAGPSAADPSTQGGPLVKPIWPYPEKAAVAPPEAAAAPATALAPAAVTGAIAATPASAASPVVEAIHKSLGDKAIIGKSDTADVEALTAFYASRSEPLWIKEGAFTEKANAAIAEVKKADDWGLEASAFALPELSSGASPEAQGEAEAKLGLAILKYSSYARGGRIDPVSLSNIWDMKPPLKDPKAVLSEIAENASPDDYLRGLNPKHPEFEKLRQALLKARGPQQPEEKIDEALKIKLPDGKTIKPGDENDDIVLLRKRLKIDAQSASNEKLYDAKLEAAVKAFQEANGLKANGQLNAKTRSALNREGEPKKADPKRDVDRLIVNMERWRWLPEDLSSFYVMNNIPEFVSRVMKDGKEELKQKIIVGQPSWATPILTSSMEFVIFHPEWGVPDGIKVKELLPRLKRASQNYGFFDQLFGGSSSGGGARVLQAYKLNPTINGRPVNADSVDWNKVDIRQFSFTQPAGGENPLGLVKFRFPNRHDVYMHDTPQKALFGQSFRALSHGCMRLDQPRKLAEIILGQDKGWSSDKVDDMYASGGEVTLTKQVPVYLTYFTVRVEDDGKLAKYADIYGNDDRLMSALRGRPVRYNAPEAGAEVATADDSVSDQGTVSETPSASKKGKKKDLPQVQAKRNGDTAGDLVSNALSGLIAN